MPLPPVLAARLRKRGILKENTAPKENSEEEVFVEHYDEPSKDEIIKPVEDKSLPLVFESVNCPNKKNPYHECTEWCGKHWGFKRFREDPNLRPKRVRMLTRYPLPDSWEEVGDPESGRFYYWNMESNEVSWLPPTHPRAHVCMPAERERAGRRARARSVSSGSGYESEEDSRRRRQRRGGRKRRSRSLSDTEESGEEEDAEMKEMTMEEFDEVERRLLQERQKREKEREVSKSKKRNDLDPMDPASYSDVPRGTWTTGLETKDRAQTGVDETAAGPLFQMRPYPSPGAVLRMNQQSKKKK